MATAERIYCASTSEDAGDGRLAERLARLIEDDIAANNAPVGGIMGSLRDLSEQYAVGRAAVREAVALLERRGLGRMRPGPAGGFVVAQPDADSISAELANYFHMIGVTAQQVIDAREAIDLIAASLAAQAGHDAETLRSLEWPADAATRKDALLQVRATIGRLSGEPVIGLFVDCLNHLIARFEGAENLSSNWRALHASHLTRLREAIENGDAGAAATTLAPLHAELDHWLLQSGERAELPALATTRLSDDRTLSTLVARRIAGEILRNPTAGKRLGSEWDLCERYSASRATLRQAIRQLEDSGLVECRRGRGNGLVVRNPRGTGSIRLVLAYLISRQMDPLRAGTFLFQLNCFIPALAVGRADRGQRDNLRKLLANVRRRDTIDRFDLLRLVQAVSQYADSPIVDLFSRSLAAYEARFHPHLMERLPAQMQDEYFELLSALMAEIESGKPADQGRAKVRSAQVMLEMSRTRPI